MNLIVMEIINKFGYLGIVLLIAIENIFPPIPSEVILTFGGFATTISNTTVIGTIVASTVGSVFGAIILYWAGLCLNKNKIYKLTEGKFGKIIGLKKENINKSFRWFDSMGKYAVFFGRFIPIIRSLVSIPAGMAKMSMFPFLILTIVGSLIWNTVLILLGRLTGESWRRVAGCIDGYSNIILISFGVFFIFGTVSYYLKKKKRLQVIFFRKHTKIKG